MANSAPGTRETRLESKVFAHGSQVSIQTAGLIPPKRRILSVDFILRCAFDQPAAGFVVQNAIAFYQLLSAIKIGRRVSIDGLGLHNLNWLKAGRETGIPASLPGTDGVFNREIKWTVDYVDRSSRSPYDGAIPSELWTDPIEIQFGASSIFAATIPVLTGTLDTIVTHDAAQVDEDSAVIPASKIIMSQDFAALDAIIEKAGAWLYACAYRIAQNDAGGLTSTQISTADTHVDGEVLAKALWRLWRTS
jgi:hypothetical protein